MCREIPYLGNPFRTEWGGAESKAKSRTSHAIEDLKRQYMHAAKDEMKAEVRREVKYQMGKWAGKHREGKRPLLPGESMGRSTRNFSTTQTFGFC